MGSFISGGGSFLADGLTITKNGADEATLTTQTQSQISDALVGVIFSEGSTGFTFTSGTADYFGDASGNENTIAAATALFDTNKYTSGGVQHTNAHGLDMTGASGGNNNLAGQGFKVHANVNCSVLYVTKAANCTADTCDIRTASDNTLRASTTFVGNVATFTGGYALSSGIDYGIHCCEHQRNATTYAFVTAGSAASYPYNGTDINLTAMRNSDYSDINNQAQNIVSITTESGKAATSTVTTVALTGLNGTYTKVRFHPYKTVLATGNNIHFGVDYTGGGTYTIDNANSDEWIDLAGAQVFNGAKLKIYINQGTGAITDSPSLSGYAFMVL